MPGCPVFSFSAGGNSRKLYMPLSRDRKSRFIWIGGKPDDFIFGFRELPQSGELCIVAAGEKDVMTLAAARYNAVTLNSESSTMPSSLFSELTKRFKHVIVAYDIDETGISCSLKLCRSHGLKRLVLPIELKEMGKKDVTDYFTLSFDNNHSGKFSKADFALLVKALINSPEAGNRPVSGENNNSGIDNNCVPDDIIKLPGNVNPAGTDAGHDNCTIGSMQALMNKKLPPTNWLIKGLISEGYALFAGRPKSGKSWAALTLACCAGLGQDYLGRYKTEKCGCLYISLEDSEKRLKNRVEVIMNRINGQSQVPENLHYALKFQQLDKGGFAALETFLKVNRGVRLVIIDTLNKVAPIMKKAYDYDGEYNYGSALQAIALKHGVTILALVHTRKTPSEDSVYDEISGSIGKQAAADTLMVLRRGKKISKLHVTGRDIDEIEMALEFNNGL